MIVSCDDRSACDVDSRRTTFKDLADASEISVAPWPLVATAIVREVANVADTPRTLESSGTLFP
jgi:hypothetical protein